MLSVSALGSTGRKAYYSNYGLEQTVVSAPGGDRREFFGTPQYNTAGRGPVDVPGGARDGGEADHAELQAAERHSLSSTVEGKPSASTCGVYVYLQGTSMASPHVVGVAALIIAAIGSGTGADFGARSRRR